MYAEYTPESLKLSRTLQEMGFHTHPVAVQLIIELAVQTKTETHKQEVLDALSLGWKNRHGECGDDCEAKDSVVNPYEK